MIRPVPVAEAPAPGVEDRPLLGAALMLLGCAALTVNDALVKSLVATHPVGQVVCLRAWIGLALMLALSPMLGGTARLRPRRPRVAAVMTALLIFGLFTFPLSLRFIPLADAIMLAYVSPILVAAASPWILREPVGWRRWGAVALGVAGAALVIRPGAEGFRLAMLLPLAVALSIAVRDLMMRRVSANESALALVAMAHLGAGVLGLGSIAWGWAAFDAVQWAVLIGAAATLTLAQVVMVSAFRYAEATVLACLKYSSIPIAAALGWAVFTEVPGPADWIGAALIAASGVVIIRRTRPASPRPG